MLLNVGMTTRASMGPSRQSRLMPVVALASSFLTLAILEFALRLWDHQLLTTRNFVLDELALLHSQYPVQFDASLGWTPKANAIGTAEMWGTTVGITILPDGTRSNGSQRAIANVHPVIVAVGDSFTFGDEVSDSETWPAWLERKLGSPVINGGVFGYGIDQIYLRARALVDKYHPDILIVSLIDDDIVRAEFSERHHAEKPYFDVVDGQLSLRNTPVPPPRPHHGGMWLRKSLGHSLLVHYLMRLLAPAFWFDASSDSIHRHGHGPEVACLLMRDLTRITRERRLRTIVLAQDELSGPSPLTCLDTDVVETVEMAPDLKEHQAKDPQAFRQKFFRVAHMSPLGNEFVAEKLYQRIRPAAQASDTSHS